MGEIAEMVLSGDMCECGEWLGGGPGYPVKCPSCVADEPDAAGLRHGRPTRTSGKIIPGKSRRIPRKT